MSGDPTNRILHEIQLLSLWCHSIRLPGVFFENLLFQIDMIRLDVRSSCTSVLNSGIATDDSQDFHGAFASDPSQPELAPLQTYLGCRCSESTARHCDNWMQKLLDSTPFPRFGIIQLRLRARFIWTICGSAVILNAEAWRNMSLRLRTRCGLPFGSLAP